MAPIRSRPERPWRIASHLAVEPVDVREDASRPLEHALPLGGQPLVAPRCAARSGSRPPLEPADPRRQRRLGDVAGGAARPKCSSRTSAARYASWRRSTRYRHDRQRLSWGRCSHFDATARGSHPVLCRANAEGSRAHVEVEGPSHHPARARRRRAAPRDLGRGARPRRRRLRPRARRPDTSTSFGIFSCSKASNEMNFLAAEVRAPGDGHEQHRLLQPNLTRS